MGALFDLKLRGRYSLRFLRSATLRSRSSRLNFSALL